MTKKDFQMLAATIRDCKALDSAGKHEYLRQDVALHFAYALERTNPRFKADLFVSRGAPSAPSPPLRPLRPVCRAMAHGVKEAERMARTLASDLAEDR